uniref:Secreted protein n=1 Tax=Chromera velia CCMP2878 TaxID=1169474 RepID=A0A0G4GP31_9ALVE|eukprot:Cvel_5004.t1-p1 / transcript=Cvel_5004.t1 / gene=Cvel_5004 / organism=Chromera_velia_CCMP2878 / gene_product=Septum-promoting GTP-binding protein 1, putative / transcript_product=Septum-promoting GTP-binding protein 1, putative / location=Cvel_scaffold226:110630-111135(-) / protein_length=69 / sequence_SO=supercontig / SO=protein_coding / is_pseudo=false
MCVSFIHKSLSACLQARAVAHLLCAPLVFTSVAESIHVQKVFGILLCRVFGLKCTIPRVETVGYPLLEY